MGNVQSLASSAAVSFGVQWIVFLVANYLKTEKFYDLTGSLTFMLLLAHSLLKTGRFFPRQVIQSGCVAMWAARLGLFLFYRVMKEGSDSRFNRVRDNPKRFFMYWTIQGLWVWLNLLPTLILNYKNEDSELCTRDYIGWGLWVAGMALEVLADYQKFTFRSNPANKDKWISHGLWSLVRHPNYLGEMLLWIGLFISASTSFKGAEYLAVVSPVFVVYLLTKVSGIPLLERANLRRWRDNPQFQAYLQSTPRLLPYLY